MKSIVVVLHNIRSVHNVGSIFRTADAAGISKISVPGTPPTPLDRFGVVRPDFKKVSLGAERSVPWEYVWSAAALLQKLKNPSRGGGYKIWAVEQAKNSVPYYRVKYHASGVKKVALVFGNEVRGLPASVLKKADKTLEVPMRGAMVREAHHPRHVGRGKESLNVSVAFGIVAFSLLQK